MLCPRGLTAMNVLQVDNGRPIKGYSSFAGAIAAANGHPRQPNARADGTLLQHQTFVTGRASYSRWRLEFTGSWYVDVECRDDEVEWKVTQTPTAFEDLTEAYVLRWPSGIESTIDPSALFANRAGAEFWQLWVNEAGLHVYLRRKLILCFHAVRRVDDRSCILAVCEDD
jgi:hypothetical protein